MSQPASLAAIYTARRRALMDRIGEGIALVDASGVSPDPLLFDKNLRYLVGPTAKDTVLLLAPGGMTIDRFETIHGPEVGRGRTVREVLFVHERSARERKVDGEGTSADANRTLAGVEAVKSLAELEAHLSVLMRHDTLWINAAGVPSPDRPPTAGQLLVEKIRQRYPWVRIRNLAPLIHEMRRVKEPYEIDCLRQAFAIQSEIFTKIMQALKPGTNESLGQAIYDYEVGIRAHEGVGGAWNDLYTSNIIVAAGGNAAIAHYMANDQPIRDGDLVLIDAGVEVEGYSSDITRAFPASGRFTARQRELYQIVLDAQRKAIATMRPGSTSREAHRAVYEHFKEHKLQDRGYGTCGHPVGLNIHDANGWAGDDDSPFAPGVVLVIEPFLALPDEGIGIRIEDGVLITESGHELLPAPPKEVEEIERLCGGRRARPAGS